jgi:hypothetical protein
MRMAMLGTTLTVSAKIKHGFLKNPRVLLRFGKARALVMNSTFSSVQAGVCINPSDGVLEFRLTVVEHELHWLRNLEDKVVGGVSGSPTVGGCGTTQGNCNPLGGMTCEAQFNQYGTDKDGNEHIIGKTSYWIFQAVRGMQSKFKMLKEELTSQAMVAGFLIPSMVKDFEGNEDQTSDVMKWLAAAVGFAGILGGSTPVAVR